MLPWFTSLYFSLISRANANKLHHALLFNGASGIGKRELVDGVAFTLLCKSPTTSGPCDGCQSCALRKAGSHPDLHILESEKQLGVDKIREGIAKLNGTAQMSGNKVLVIPKADSMTEAAANALLKTLEEPTNNTYLLLITESLSKLMPTIRSRCEKHALALPSVDDGLNYLHNHGVEDASEALLQAYGYAPLRIARALQGENDFNYRNFTDGMEALLSGNPDVQPIVLANKWQDYAIDVSKWCQQRALQAYKQHAQTRDYERYCSCVEASKVLQHPGVNKSMVLFNVLKQFQR